VKGLAARIARVDDGAVRGDGGWRPNAVELVSLAIAGALLCAVAVAVLLS